MQKLFFAICFITAASFNAEAKVAEVLDANRLPQPQQMTAPASPITHQVSEEQLGDFIKERLESTVIQDTDKVTSGAIFVEPSVEARQAAEEAKKGTFEKIYDEAMRRATAQPTTNDLPQQDPQMGNQSLPPSLEQQQQEWNTPDFPVINVLLPPDNQKVVVPAREHIPYLMTNIEILPDGLIKFDETMVVVAGGNKLKYGLSKVLPRHIYSRSGERQKLGYALQKVLVNSQEVPYKIVEGANEVRLAPQERYVLEPGVYTYTFQYVIDRALWNYGNFREFYWDVTGSDWNLVIAKAGATITLPPAVAPLGQETFTGYPDKLRNDLITVIHPSPATYGYAAQEPLFVGEGFHLILSLPEDAITPPTLGKRLTGWFDSYGDIIIASLALVFIWLSFKISGRYIKANKGQLKIGLKKNAAMLRYLAFNRFDKTSLMSFLLELYRKNIIDIQQADNTILLIKRTDHLQTLTKAERKAVMQLFSGNDAVFNVNRSNLLKIRRASDLLEKDLHRKLWRYLLALNSGYLFFSLGMLVLAQLFIAFLQLDPWPVFTALITGTITMLAGTVLFVRKEPRLWQQISFKTLGSLLILGGLIICAARVSLWAGLLMLAAVIVIEYYTTFYAQRSGLLKEQINESLKQRDYLLEHKENILRGREIINQQPNIVALDLIDEFAYDSQKNEFYKLDVIKAILKKLSA